MVKVRINGKAVTKRIPLPAGSVRIETFIPWSLVKRGVRREVITPIGAPAEFRNEAQQAKSGHEKHSPLIRSLGLAHYWQQLLDAGKFRSITEIAAVEGMDVGRVSRILQLSRLGPTLVTTLSESPAPKQRALTEQIPLLWAKQCAWPARRVTPDGLEQR